MDKDSTNYGNTKTSKSSLYISLITFYLFQAHIYELIFVLESNGLYAKQINLGYLVSHISCLHMQY